jgi:hypothetical protein
MTLDGYGEHLIHLEHVAIAREPVRGVYFGKRGFLLSIMQGKVLVERNKVKWTDAGSKEYLRAFVLSSNQDWFGVNSLCSQLKVKILDCSKCNCLDTAFLGAGATGRVVAVDREDVSFEHCRQRDTFGSENLPVSACQYIGGRIFFPERSL